MSRKIFTKEELVGAIDDELSWRKKELKVFKDLVNRESAFTQKALLRCSIPTIYSHWEGFVKSACQYYLEYVSNRQAKFSELKPQFITLALNKHLNKLEMRNIEDKTKAIKFIIDNLENKSNIHSTNAIHTKSNLRYEVFKDICFLLDIDVNLFSIHESLINDLVDTRNTIAHGNGHKISYSTFIDFYDESIILLETLRTELDNAAVLDKHLI